MAEIEAAVTENKDGYVSEAEALLEKELRLQQPPPAQAQQQDIARPAPPDRNWRRQQPVQLVVPPERLLEKHQTFDIANVSNREAVNGVLRPQTHYVMDRRMNGIEIQPGEIKHGIDMLVRDIVYFRGERDPTRVDQFQVPKPLHPIVILNIPAADKADKPAKNARTT